MSWRADRPWQSRLWRLVAFRLAMTALGVALALSALIGGLWNGHIYFTYAATASAALLFARAWWEHLRHVSGRDRAEKALRLPYALRGPGQSRRHKPAFLMNAADFDDDLTAQTLPDEEALSESERRQARIAGYGAAGVLMLVLSFIL